MPAETVDYRAAAIDEIYELRFAVLRPKLVPMKLHFEGDDGMPPATWHFGAFTPEPLQNIGCLTLLASPWEERPALQLRGMAVAPEYRGKGVGTRLLRAAEGAVAIHPIAQAWIWWCNARVEAITFYERNGWQVASEEFLIKDVGPHRKMVRGNREMN